MACMRGLCLKALCVVALVPAYASFRAGASELGPLIKDVQVAAYDRQNEYGNPGSCGFGAINETTWPFGALIAVQSNNTIVKNLPNHGCGTCFTISCADKNCRRNSLPVSGLVVDSCPACTASFNLIDLPITRFVALTNMPRATVNATVQQVDCMPPGNITIRILNNPQINLMLELVLLNVRGSGIIKTVDLKNSQQDDSAWVPMEVFNGAIWQAGNLPPVPLDLRITNRDGQVVIARGFYKGGSGGDCPTEVQFPASERGASAPGAMQPTAPEAATKPAGQPQPAKAPPPSSRILRAPAPGPLLSPKPALQAPPPLNAPPVLPACPGDVSNLQVVATDHPSNQPCRTLLSLLQASPSLSKWLKLLQDRGLASALSNPSQQLTMFAPVDSAFSCNIFAGSNALAATIDQIANATENSVAAIVGGQVVPGYYPSSRLQPGVVLNTTDQIQKEGQRAFIELHVAPASIDGPIQVQGVGSAAKLLQHDIEACGPSVMHITDRFLLPFAPTPSEPQAPNSAPMARATEGPPSITVGFPQVG